MRSDSLDRKCRLPVTALQTPYARGRGRAAAALIAAESDRLAALASANGFDMLAYLLDITAAEARREAAEPEGPPVLDAAARGQRSV